MMDKTNTWLIRVFAVVLICVCLFSYLNAQANQSLLRSKPRIVDLKIKNWIRKEQMQNLLQKEIIQTMKNLEV